MLPKLGISGYGISVTTLEEVFLRAGKDEAEEDKAIEHQEALVE